MFLFRQPPGPDSGCSNLSGRQHLAAQGNPCDFEMGDEKETVSFKSLAPWKTWWGPTSVAYDLTCSIKERIDPTKLPGGGKVVAFKVDGKVTGSDLDDPVQVYPADRDPSAYLLGGQLASPECHDGGCHLWASSCELYG